jgi:hypothetical protein
MIVLAACHVRDVGYTGSLPDVPFAHRLVSATRREDLRHEIAAAHGAGLLSDLVNESFARIFTCPLPEELTDARSLIVGALPHPQSSVGFTWRGARFSVLVPPSYVRYWELTRDAEDLLNELLEPGGLWARFARVPQKALAVHSGLARYGRSNITYVPGLGSFYMFVSYSQAFAATRIVGRNRNLSIAVRAVRDCVPVGRDALQSIGVVVVGRTPCDT